jgi:flavin-dependent dehydrogenase
MRVFDLAVIGGGPAGSVATWVLARAGHRVALFDDGGRSLPQLGESLPAAAGPLLRALELEPCLVGHLPSHGNTFAWGSRVLASMDALRDPHGHGWHLDRIRFDADLRKRAIDVGATPVRERVVACREVDGGVQLRTESGAYAARHVIDATGRRAAVARRLGAVLRRDDRLVALCAWTRSSDRDSRTLVEACPAGWWYTAALPDGGRSVVLHTDGEVARRLSDPVRWRALLRTTNHVQHLVGPTGVPRGAAACGVRLDRFAGSRWIAVGDAACAFDPISSQGIFFAIYSGMRAAQALLAGYDGDRDAVRRYCERLEKVRAAYLSRQRLAYAAEARWPDAPFWARRHLTGDAQRPPAVPGPRRADNRSPAAPAGRRNFAAGR